MQSSCGDTPLRPDGNEARAVAAGSCGAIMLRPACDLTPARAMPASTASAAAEREAACSVRATP